MAEKPHEAIVKCDTVRNYVSKFTAAVHGSPCNSMAFVSINSNSSIISDISNIIVITNVSELR